MNKLMVVRSAADLGQSIEQIKVAGKLLDDHIQTTAVGVLEHFRMHKDTGLINRLYNAMPKGARKAAMTSWLLAYGAVVANTGKDKDVKPFVTARDKQGNWTKVTNPEAAAQDPWFDHAPDKAPTQVLDLQAAVKAIIRRAVKAPGLEHGDYSTLLGMAALVGIPASDVPTMPAAVAQVEEALL